MEVLLLVLLAATLGSALARVAHKIDARRGGTEAIDALASAGLSLIAKPRERTE